jgi:hypothetical protein
VRTMVGLASTLDGPTIDRPDLGPSATSRSTDSATAESSASSSTTAPRVARPPTTNS